MAELWEEERKLFEEENSKREEMIKYATLRDVDRQPVQKVMEEIRNMYCKLMSCLSRRESFVLQEVKDRQMLLKVGLKICNEWLQEGNSNRPTPFHLLKPDQQKKLLHATKMLEFFIGLTPYDFDAQKTGDSQQEAVQRQRRQITNEQ
ncbi:NR LBD domain-containing protein [Caenorhabditis elegans]|uniref:NR LBD domain-containing protein n=1 Tax=Caenorhabditis elegans TaxID=6239 RepID=Q23199_CAEEL|nr:NR LBD domain-containing protein [Caenorhabditis elegans]CAA93537.1 NR LBD domain-containing protein [Caenorhabditis elegans]|eukprot:NP_510055.1 Uncharacterized protein CELE_W06D11.5 [Caenorhabditis elegans]